MLPTDVLLLLVSDVQTYAALRVTCKHNYRTLKYPYEGCLVVDFRVGLSETLYIGQFNADDRDYNMHRRVYRIPNKFIRRVAGAKMLEIYHNNHTPVILRSRQVYHVLSSDVPNKRNILCIEYGNLTGKPDYSIFSL